MKALAMKLDGSRPASIAPTGAIGTAGGLVESDVAGYNYMDPQAEEFHKKRPDKPVMGTETVSAVGTRGIYITDPSKGYVASYDPYTTTGRASAEGWWSFCNSRPWLSGGFVWTGFDYRGEPSPNGWPNISSQYGIIDTCGFPKDSFYYYKSWWTNEPVLHLFPHWNWEGMEGKTISVWVYSNLDKVELLHNGQSLGTKDMKKDGHVAWVVKYAPGAIEARGYKGDKVVMTEKRETTGAPAKLVIRADRQEVSADGEDVAMFAVEVKDAQDRVVPITENEVTFKISGEGKLDRHRQRRSHRSRSRQRHRAQSVLRILHGRGAVNQEGRRNKGGSHLAWARFGNRDDHGQSGRAAAPRGRVAARSSEGRWHHRPVEAGRAREGGSECSAISGRRQTRSIRSSRMAARLTGTVEGTSVNFTGGSDVPAPVVKARSMEARLSSRWATTITPGPSRAIASNCSAPSTLDGRCRSLRRKRRTRRISDLRRMDPIPPSAPTGTSRRPFRWY